MILAEIRTYLSGRGRAPLSDLAHRFGVDEGALRSMLDVWVRKGRVRRLDSKDGSCGSCCGCGETAPEVYEWVDRH